MCELDAIRFDYKAEHRSVSIKGPVPASRVQLKPMFVIAVERAFGDGTVLVSEHDVDSLLANPVDRNDLDCLSRQNSAHEGGTFYVFKPDHNCP